MLFQTFFAPSAMPCPTFLAVSTMGLVASERPEAKKKRTIQAADLYSKLLTQTNKFHCPFEDKLKY